MTPIDFSQRIFHHALCHKNVTLAAWRPDKCCRMKLVDFHVGVLTELRQRYIDTFPNVDLGKIKFISMCFTEGPPRRTFTFPYNSTMWSCDVRSLGFVWLRSIACARRIQRAWRRYSSRRYGAAKRIQRAWVTAWYDPEYAVCKRRMVLVQQKWDAEGRQTHS